MPGQETKVINTTPEPETLTLSDLEKSQKIQAFCNDNIKNQDQFTADKISLIVKLDK